jgi:non-specific serine/threonine protein kinase
MRAALEWGKTDTAGAPAYVRLAGALFWFWYLRGHWVEGRKWLEAALVRSEDVEAAARIRAFEGTAMLARDQGDHAHGDALAAKGLALSREAGDKHGVAWFLLTLGISAMAQSDDTRAITLTEESLALCEEIGDTWLTIITFHTLGYAALKQADYGRAAAFFEKCLSLSREVGDKYVIAMELRNLGYLALTQREYRRAATLAKESLTLCKEVGPRWLTEVCLRDLAIVACAAGSYGQAARLFGAAEASREFLERYLTERAHHDRGVAEAKAQLGESTFAECWAEGRAMTLAQALEYALAVESSESRKID